MPGPSYAGQPDVGTAVRWQTIFGTAPTAVSLVLQGAMADVDAEYQTIDTSVATTGEARTVNGVQAKGAALDDPTDLFNSSLEGNTRRAIDFHQSDKIDEKALKALIREAAALNASARAARKKPKSA